MNHMRVLWEKLQENIFFEVLIFFRVEKNPVKVLQDMNLPLTMQKQKIPMLSTA